MLKIPGLQSNLANFVTAKTDVADIADLFGTTIQTIFEVSNGVIKSWRPGRTINSLKEIIAGNSYYIIPNEDIDVSANFQYDGTGAGGDGLQNALNGLTVDGSTVMLGGELLPGDTIIEFPNGDPSQTTFQFYSLATGKPVFTIGSDGSFFIGDTDAGFVRGNVFGGPVEIGGALDILDRLLIGGDTGTQGQVVKRGPMNTVLWANEEVYIPTINEVLNQAGAFSGNREMNLGAFGLNIKSASFPAGILEVKDDGKIYAKGVFDLLNNLLINGVAGTEGQFIKKGPGDTLVWGGVTFPVDNIDTVLAEAVALTANRSIDSNTRTFFIGNSANSNGLNLTGTTASLGDKTGANDASISTDKTAKTVAYKATNGHAFTGDVAMGNATIQSATMPAANITAAIIANATVSGAISLPGGDIQTQLNQKRDIFSLAERALGAPTKAYTHGFPFLICNTPYNLVDGNIRWQSIYLEEPSLITGINFWIRTQGNYTADNENLVALWSYNGAGVLTKVATSANDGTLWSAQAANSIKTVPFTAAVNLAAGLYFFALIYNSSAQVTAPALGGGTGLNSPAQAAKNYSNSAKSAGVTVAATMPAGPINISTLSQSNQPIWAELY